MKKQPLRRKAPKQKKKLILPIGVVVVDLVLWDFSNNEDVIRHNAGELAKAIYMSYSLDHFGPASFGIEDEE